MTKSPSIVLDSSVIIKWLNRINENELAQADNLLEHLQMGKVYVLAPLLAKYEVSNALLKGKELAIAEAFDALNLFYKLPIQYVDLDETSAQETYEIAHQYNLTFYDASFIVLAKQKNAILITANPKHQQKFSQVKVVALKNYRG